MKDLKLNKEVANRLQDNEMANLVGAGTDVDVTNTAKGKAEPQAMEEVENRSCCQKSCR